MKTQTFFYTMVFCLITSVLFAKNDVNETITLRGITDQINRIHLQNYNYDMVISPSKSDSIILKTFVTVEGVSVEDYQHLKNALKSITFEHKKPYFRIDNKFFHQMKSKGLKTTIKLSNGETIQVEDIKINYHLWLPVEKELNLISRYGDIEIPDYAGTINAQFYDCKVKTGSFLKSSLIDIKYGSIDMVDANEIKINAYDSEVNARWLGDLFLQAKYSKIKCKGAGSTKINSYDDEIEMGKVGNTNLQAKYSNLLFQQTNRFTLDIYDCDMVCDQAGDVKIKSKYSTLKMKKLDSYASMSNYDDEIKLGELGDFKVSESKYSDFKIKSISGEILYNGYDCILEMLKVDKEFEKAMIEAKYGKVYLVMIEGCTYSIEAERKYGKLKIDKALFDVFNEKTTGSTTTLDASMTPKDAGADNVIKLNTYSVDVVIE